MTDKTVLITGANKSIGYETARQFARLGYRVWLGSRDETRGKAAVATLVEEGHKVRLLPIDVTSDASVKAAVEQVQKEDGKLDVLINNAGIIGGPQSAPSKESMDSIREVYETNLFGPIRVTQAFLPLLTAAAAKSGQANVVMVSSGLGSLTWLSDPKNPFYGVNVLGYNSSKSALNMATVSFAKEFAPLGIKVNTADPGYTATDLNGHTGYRTVEQAAAGLVWLATQESPTFTGKFYFEQTEVPW